MKCCDKELDLKELTSFEMKNIDGGVLSAIIRTINLTTDRELYAFMDYCKKAYGIYKNSAVMPLPTFQPILIADLSKFA